MRHPTPALTRITWHLQAVMKRREFNARSLHQAMREKDSTCIGYSQLAKMVKERPQRLDLDVLGLLVEVLECSLGDLIGEARGYSNKGDKP